MGHETEAACLLKSGAMYARRVGLISSSIDPVFAGLKPGAFSIYWGDEPIVHFDLEGRWQRAYIDGTHFLKGLDTTAQAIERVREIGGLVLKRRTLSFSEAADLDGRIRALALNLAAQLDGGGPELVDPPPGVEPIGPDELRSLLDRAARWDAAAWFAHRERYVAAYGDRPLPFLPPDCPHAVVLLATTGNVGGRSFGGNRSTPLQACSPREFEEHARRVSELLGRRILLCNSVFLGGGDALRQPGEVVDAYLLAIAREFPPVLASHSPPNDERARRGRWRYEPTHDRIHAFLEDFEEVEFDVATWRRWSALGLRRATLGIESGDARIRARYGKRWTDDSLRRVVTAMKQAGVGAGLAILVGAGGSDHAGDHLAATVDLIESLDLGPGDLISLLDERELLERDGTAAPEGMVEALEGQTWQAQLATFKERLAPLRARCKVKVAPYSLDKQGTTS